MLRKIFNRDDYPRIKFWIIWGIIVIAMFIPSMLLVNKIDDVITERWRKSKAEKEVQEIQEEIERRIAERDHVENNIIITPSDSQDVSEIDIDKTPNNSTSVTQLLPETSDPPSRTFTSGPYKGMTPEEIESLHKLRIEHTLRDKAYSDKLRAAAEIRSKNMNDTSNLMLSIFKLLSHEQLQHVRAEALKDFSEQDVEYFFNDLENKGVEMTEEQLTVEARRILASDETLDIIFRELAIEREQLKQEYKELYGEEEYNEIYGSE